MRRKNKAISIFVTQKDYEQIRKNATRCGKNLTAYLTDCGLNKSIIVLDGVDNLIGQVKRIGQQLNRLTLLANMNKIQVVYLNDAAKELNKINQSIQRLLKMRNG